jgi:hypothetical protein
MYKSRPQKLGTGTTVRYITFESTIGTSATIMNLGDQLYTDEELKNYMERYNYMKVENIKVKVTPTSNTGKIYLLGQWNLKDSTVTVNDLINNDSTKIIATHTIKFQTRTWLPPNMNATIIDKNSIGSDYIATINTATYNRTDDYYYSKGTTPATYSILYPFTLAMKSTVSVEVSVIVKVKFRGEKFTTTLNALITLYKNDNQLKEKVDKMKQESAIKKEFIRNKIAEEMKEENDEQQKEEEFDIEVGEKEEEVNQKKDAINEIIDKIKNL